MLRPLRNLRWLLILWLTCPVSPLMPTSAHPLEGGTDRMHWIPDRLQAERPRPRLQTPPTGEQIINPAEFCRADGMLLDWAEYVCPYLTELAQAVATDEVVYVVVQDAASQNHAHDYLAAHDVNMDHVIFIMDTGSTPNPWIRDFGPFCIYADGDLAITDFYYGLGYGIDDLPVSLAAYFDLSCYRTGVLHHGGNHISDGNGMAFASTNIWDHNPGATEEEIRDQFREYLGIDSLVVVEPMLGDMTRHIDMFCKLLNDTLFAVGEYAAPEQGYPGDFERLNELASLLASLHNLDGRPFRVVRLPMLPYESGLNRTYLNSLILNEKVLVPTYEHPSDDVAVARYAEWMPDCQIIPVDSRMIIEYAGAAHCVTSCIHSANPLVVFHEPIDTLLAGQMPVVRFSLNPGFEQMEASVHWEVASEPGFQSVPATWAGGRWRADLPPMVEDFRYYIAGRAILGETSLEVYLPSGAPLEAFEVVVTGASGVAVLRSAPRLECHPNPVVGRARIAWSFPAARHGWLELVDPLGRRLRRWPCVGEHGRCTWDGAGDGGRRLPAGRYYLRLHDGERSYQRAVVRLP